MTTAAYAVPVNLGFELPDITPDAYRIATPSSWNLTPSVHGGDVVILKSPTFTVTEGTQALDLSGLSPNPPAAPTAGGVQQTFANPLPLRPTTITYDWTSKCAGSDVRVFMDGFQIDSATNPAATYPTYTTRVVSVLPGGPSTSLRFDTTTTGPTLASNSICGTIIDNVTFIQAATVNPTASPASQCTGATGHNVQFRKVDPSLYTPPDTFINSGAQADLAYLRDATDPAVLRQATDNGVATINYSDGGVTTPGQPPAPRDVAEPPLTGVSGPSPFTAGIDENFVMRSSGYISIPTAGVWTFKVYGDDTNRLLIGQPALLVLANEGPNVPATTVQTATVSIAAPGCYHCELQHANGLGGSAIALTASSATVPETLVGAGPLPVFRGTDSPLTCQIFRVVRGPSFISPNDTMSAKVSDLDGIGGVYNIQATNATVQTFQGTWGTTGPIEVRATKITQGSPAAWSFTASDWNGNTKTCTDRAQ